MGKPELGVWLRRLLIAGTAALGLGGAGLAIRLGLRGGTTEEAVRPRPIPGERGRVVVEVLNATSGVGLARIATGKLRDAGLDVVHYASDTSRTLDSTEVLVRRGEARAGAAVRDALGVGLVRSAPDPGRLVDVTVRIGHDFRALVRDP